MIFRTFHMRVLYPLLLIPSWLFPYSVRCKFLCSLFCSIVPLSNSYFLNPLLSSAISMYKNLLTKYDTISDIARRQFAPCTWILKLLKQMQTLQRTKKSLINIDTVLRTDTSWWDYTWLNAICELRLNHMTMLQWFCLDTEHIIKVMYITWNIQIYVCAFNMHNCIYIYVYIIWVCIQL